MVSAASIISVCVAAVASVASADSSVLDLAVGEFYHPEGTIVSAAPSTDAPFRRTPCPLLNTLANHGYLPRDGKNVTKDAVRAAITTQINLDIKFVETLLAAIPGDVFDLNLLGTHGLIEHDASLVHADSAFGFDPVRIDPDLVADVLRRANAADAFSVQELGELRRDRLVACKTSNAKCSFSARDTTIAFGEAGLIVDVLGGNKNSTISKAHLESFLVQERFPQDYVKSPSIVTLAQIQTTAGKIVAVASRPRRKQ